MAGRKSLAIELVDFPSELNLHLVKGNSSHVLLPESSFYPFISHYCRLYIFLVFPHQYHQFPWNPVFSYDFPMIFPYFPMVFSYFPWFSHGFVMFCGFPTCELRLCGAFDGPGGFGLHGLHHLFDCLLALHGFQIPRSHMVAPGVMEKASSIVGKSIVKTL